MASSIFLDEFAKDNLINPSPLAPNALPGTVVTRTFSIRNRVKSQDDIPNDDILGKA